MKRSAYFLIALVLVAQAGCGKPDKIQAKGKLLKDGQPLTIADDKVVVDIRFIPLEGEQKSGYPGELDRATGNFTAKEIPPGKYRISVRYLDPYPTNDVLQDKFGLASSPIIREVKADEEIVIDLSKPEG